jgi:hypothetical protein
MIDVINTFGRAGRLGKENGTATKKRFHVCKVLRDQRQDMPRHVLFAIVVGNRSFKIYTEFVRLGGNLNLEKNKKRSNG